jgi:glutaredoxin-like protein NrdH
MTRTPTLLTQPGCHNCKMVERKLDDLGIPYEVVNIRENDDWFNWMVHRQLKSTPVLVNRADYVIGFDPDGIEELVNQA